MELQNIGSNKTKNGNRVFCVSCIDYDLSIFSYVETKDIGEKIDMVKLNAEIKEIVAREQVLCNGINKIIKEIRVNYEGRS